jgi:hypothetical protein
MSEPLPVQPVTIDYAGARAALGPPIRHPGMQLPTSHEEARAIIRQGLFGAFFAASLVLLMACVSDLGLPDYSSLRLAKPILPIVGMFVVGIAAQRLSGDHARRGWPVGLWLGGWVMFGLYGMHLMTIGYVGWVAALF